MTRIAHLMMDDSMTSNFSIYHTSDAILGHIFFLVEICRSSWSHMILITHKMHVELIAYCYLIMIPQWSLSWAIQSGLNFSIFRCPHVSSSERCLLTYGFDSVVDLDDWDHAFDDGWFEVVRFSNLPHVRCYTGAYLLFVEIVDLSLIWQLNFILIP